MEPSRILYHDNHLIAVNKRASEIVQGDKTGDVPLSETVKAYLKQTCNKPGNVFLGVVHRIDRPVSGIVLFARTGKALARLNRMLQERTMEKIYLAVVKHPLPGPEGLLTHHLKRDTVNNVSRICSPSLPGAKEAKLNYRLLARSDTYYIYEINLLTGRHHQIRAQLAAAGSPVKGDVKYGFQRANHDRSIHLHAWKLSFIHPVKNLPVMIKADTPRETLWNSFNLF
jgi:23S rRNA pseudouridine1911/1915/1917 synthase